MAISLFRNFFEKKLWPEFNEKDYNKIIKNLKVLKEILEIFDEQRINKRIISSILLIPISSFFYNKGSFLFIFFISICFCVSIYEWQ